MHTVDASLRAERKRGFRIDMETLPKPEQLWQHNKAIQRRGPLRSLESRAVDRRDPRKTSARVKRNDGPSQKEKMIVTYEKNVLVIEDPPRTNEECSGKAVNVVQPWITIDNGLLVSKKNTEHQVSQFDRIDIDVIKAKQSDSNVLASAKASGHTHNSVNNSSRSQYSKIK